MAAMNDSRKRKEPEASVDSAMDAVEMIHHGISLAVRVPAGTNLTDEQQILNHPAALEAMGKSIATGLGLAHTDVEILSVNVLQARRLSIVNQPPQQRLLTSSSGSSAHVSVSYQVRTHAAASAGMSASTLSSRMTALGNSSSSSNQRFTKAFGPNLQTAATQMGSEGSLLSSVAQEVAGRGVVVIKSETPQTFTIQAQGIANDKAARHCDAKEVLTFFSQIIEKISGIVLLETATVARATEDMCWRQLANKAAETHGKYSKKLAQFVSLLDAANAQDLETRRKMKEVVLDSFDQLQLLGEGFTTDSRMTLDYVQSVSDTSDTNPLKAFEDYKETGDSDADQDLEDRYRQACENLHQSYYECMTSRKEFRDAYCVSTVNVVKTIQSTHLALTAVMKAMEAEENLHAAEDRI